MKLKEYQIRKINKTTWYATVEATSWEKAEELGHTDLNVNWELQMEDDDITVLGSPDDHETPSSSEHTDPY